MRTLPVSALLVLMAGLAAAATAQAQATRLYQWKDASGVTHYSDKPPEGRNANDRSIVNHGEPATPTAPAAKPAESAQCSNARHNLDILSKNVKVQVDNDGDGKPDDVLDEAGHANQKAIAEAEVRAYCTAPATAR